jgi:hypothetical protein
MEFQFVLPRRLRPSTCDSPVALLLLVSSILHAAPVAVDDSYEIGEDLTLNTQSGPVISADFDTGVGQFSPTFDGDWNYLDRMENSEGAGESYPVDGAARTWNSIDFEVSTSTLGPWDSGALPLQGGLVNAFPPTTLNTLRGIGDSANNLNTVTTYLFRNTFTLTSAEAAEPVWVANLAVDDGCVIYLNGREVGSLYMPAAVAITADTFAVGGNESIYSDVALDVSGVLVAGVNTIAVEVHQGTLGSSDIGLDLSLRSGAGANGGFVFADDVFGTNQPDYADGSRDPSGGQTGAGLQIAIGGLDNRFVQGPFQMSGGFVQEVTLAGPTELEISFQYRLVNTNSLEQNEFGEAIFELDGVRYGDDTNDSLVHISDGANSGWQAASFSVSLNAGVHTFTFGAYSGGTSRGNERITVFFDDILVNRTNAGTSGGVLENDTLGENSSAALVAGPSHGLLTFPAEGVFLYTPDLNFFGTDSFTYEATDETGTSAPATVTINVISENDGPIAGNNTYNVDEENLLGVSLPAQGVLHDDADVEMDLLSAVLVDDVSNGVLALSANGTFTYTPDGNFFGTDSFTYRADDAIEQSEPATVTITVANTPDPPDAQNDSYLGDENEDLVVASSMGVGTTTNVPYGAEWKYDDSGTNLQQAWRNPAYDDSQWESGLAELGYGDGDEETEVEFGGDQFDRHPTTYFRHTFAVSNAPSIQSATCWIHRDDGAVVYLNGTQIGIDNIQDDPNYGTFAGNAGDDGNAEIELPPIDPALFVEGNNTLAVEIHQNTASSSDISFDLRLELGRPEQNGVLANDSDPDGESLTAIFESGPVHGSVSLHADGTFIYTPGLNFEGSDSFTYRAHDGGLSTVATASITVRPGPNDIPDPQPDSYSPIEETLFVINAAQGVLANDDDPDGDPMTAILKSTTSHGTLMLAPDGSFSYTPGLNFFGVDSFTYVASDDLAESPVETVTLMVSNTPDAPIAISEEYATDPGELLIISGVEGVLGNDSDPDGSGLTAELVSSVSSGFLGFLPDGSFVFNPADSNAGSVSFTYRASDGVLRSLETTVTIHLDIAPVAVIDFYQPTEDVALSVHAAQGVLHNDNDAENDPLTAILISAPIDGELTLNSDGSFTYSPSQNATGIQMFSYLATDGARNSAPVPVVLNIKPVNDEPAVAEDFYLAIVDQELVVEAAAGVLANDFDVDSAELTAALANPPLNGSVVLNADGSFVYNHTPGFIGADSFGYVANDGTLNSLPGTVTVLVGGAADSIVINEIMYHPASELDAHEYIELANIGDGPVNLSGWSFTSGFSYTFPDVSIPAGEYLIVAADPTEFTALHGVVPQLTGGWTGSLSNSGERIRLADAEGNQVDELSYADQGDWATRTQVRITGEDGWAWESDHDGGGSSLELVHARLTNKSGQNWQSSVGMPTPGAANSVALDESAVAPLVQDVEHTPRVPTSTDTVTIRARLRDTTTVGLSATLYYRVSEDPEIEFSTTPMGDDGLHNDGDANDGLFGAALPAMVENTIVEFYVFATDGVNERTWPAPTSIGQVANALYQVDDEAAPEGEGMYRLILTARENRAFNRIDRDSNAQMNCTLIADDCSGPVIRYLCGMRVRGASSRNDTPPPMRLNIPRDRRWDGTSSMNLNSQFTWLQFIGMKLFQASDLPAPDSKRIALRRNGQDPTSGDLEDYGRFVHLQPLNGDLIDEKIPNDRQGNLYKKVRPDVDWAFRDGNFGRYSQDGWGKQTNESENDWSDLDEFLRVMNQASGDPDYIAQVEVVANLDQWMRWFAVEALIVNGETNASNGADDDYSMYRGTVDSRFIFLPHDLDTILSFGDGSRITDPEFTIFDMIERGDTLAPLTPLFTDPSIRTRYHHALRDLIQTSFSKARFDALVRNSLSGWVPGGVVEDVITFMDARRAHISGLVDAELGPPGPALAPVTLASQMAPHGALYLSEILAVNVTAHAVAGTHPDYVELRNAGPVVIPLAGYTITDDPGVPDKFVFPGGSAIGVGRRLLLYADSGSAPGIHLGFALNAGGESVSIFDPAGTLVDSVNFGPQVADMSIGRTGVAETAWSLNQPTPGGANQIQSLGPPGALRINEWLTKPELVYNDDFIEIYNPGVFPVSLGGLAITDDPLNFPRRAVLPALSYVGGGGFAVLEAVGASKVNTPAELPFNLSADYGWLAIYGSSGAEIDRVHTLCDSPDESQGRETDGAPLFAQFAVPTPGFSNTTDLSAESLILQSLRITEIMYNPTGGSDAEYIELRNIGADPINLSGLAFTKGVSFDFPAMTLAPGEYVVVVADQSVFEGLYGFGVNLAGEWSGKLDNDHDRIRLEIEDLNAALLDFSYQDFWYPSTDGGGFSLVIVDESAAPGSWGVKESWTADAVQSGSPGMNSGFFVFAGADQALTFPTGATLNATVHYGSLDPATVTLAWSLENGPGVATFGSPTNEDTTVTVPIAGRYTFELIATPQVGPVVTGQVSITFRDSYERWAAWHFGLPPGPESNELADGDRDGFANLVEFVLGFDPAVGDSGSLLQPVVGAGGALSLTYFRRYLAEGITVTPEVSSDLLFWQAGPASISETILGSTVDGEFILVEDLFGQDGMTPRFLRLRVDTSK